MTQAEAKHLAKILEAYANNKPIQIKINNEWVDIEIDIKVIKFDAHPFDYRIKPQEKRIPLDYNSLIEHFKNFPCTLIKDDDDWIYNILGFNKDYIRIHKISIDSSKIITYKELLKYKWLVTNKPCGILII